MNDYQTGSVLDEISQEGLPQDTNLLPGVLSQVQKRNQRAMKPIAKFGLTVLLAGAVLSVLFFTLPEAASAMRRMLGFIPGIGLVDQTLPLRVLAQPVTARRDGFTLTVENAVIDTQRSVITYTVEGPFEARMDRPEGALSDVCFAAAELRLPDGSVLRSPDDVPAATWASGYRVQNAYPALPAGVDRAVLVLPCLHARLAGHGPENWEVPLTFIPAPPDLTVYPVGAQLTPRAAESTQPAAGAPRGLDLALEGVIPLPDGQLVQMRVDWRGDPAIAQVSIHAEDVKILDAAGREVPFEPSADALDPAASGGQSASFGYKTAPIAAPGPARLVVGAASEVTYRASAGFSFDPGPHRQPEQTWRLDQDLTLDGRVLRILSVTVAERDGNASLSVEMRSPDGITGAAVFDPAQPPISGSSGTNDDGSFWTSFNYEGGLPDGPLSLTVTAYTLRLEGPWEVEWTPAAGAAVPTSAVQPQGACLSAAGWKAAQADPQPLPAGLNRAVVFEGYDAGTDSSFLATARLDGSQTHSLIARGGSAAVSPDGSRVVYLGPDGVSIYDLAAETVEVVPGTGTITGVFRPFWSPDGQSIAFTGTPGSTSPKIYLAGLDGEGARPLGGSEPLQLMQGWLPDGRILYLTLDLTGPMLKLVDPSSGQASPLFNVPQLDTAAVLSPDGRRLALSWVEQPGGPQTLYVFTLDGSQRKPLLEVDAADYLRGMLWTPDGEWLLVDLSWDVAGEGYTQALVQVDTCQIIPVSDLKEGAAGWLP